MRHHQTALQSSYRLGNEAAVLWSAMAGAALITECRVNRPGMSFVEKQVTLQRSRIRTSQS